MAVGARIRVYGDWDPSGVNKAKKDILSFSNQVEGFTSGMTKSFAGVGAAIGGAFALTAVVSTMTNFLRESTQAAMEDEKSMVALAVAMENMGLAAQNAPVEDFIKKLSLATGVADDNLRPALQRLITVTGDVATSQSALQLAMDISAGTGRDLDSVTTALAKAYGGQTTALGRLGVGLDQAVLKSKDMDRITAELSAKFEGQASAAAETMQGKMNRLTVAINEAKETLGYEFLAIIDNAATALGGVGGLTGAIDQTSETSANLVAAAGAVVEALADLRGEITGTGAAAQQSVDPITLFIGATADIIPASNPVVGAVGRVSAGFLVLKERLDALNGTDITMGGLLSALSDAFNAFTNPGKAATQMVVDFGKSTREARGAVSGTAAAAVAAGKAMGTTLTPETYDAATAADKAAKSYLALWESIWNTRRAAADLANTSGTVTSALAAGAKTGGVPEYWEKLRVAYGEAEKSARSAGSAASESAKGFGELRKELLASLEDSPAERYAGIIEQLRANLNTAQQAFTAFKDSVVQSITQAFSFGDAYQAAKDSGITFLDALTKQAENAVAFADRIKQLVILGLSPAALQQVLAAGVTAGTGIANQLIEGGATTIEQTNRLVETTTAAAAEVAELAASAYFGAGVKSAQDTLDGFAAQLGPDGPSNRRMQRIMDNLADSLRRETTITVTTVHRSVFESVGLPGRALGGPVISSQAYIVGERGPEVFVPDVSGTIIPNNVASSPGRGGLAGGPVTINVNAGMGTDGAEVGRQIVDALRQYQRRNGPVPISVA